MGVKDVKKAYVRSTNGLKGEREKKMREEGSKRGEGMAEKGTRKPTSQPRKQIPPWHSYYFSGCTARKMCDLGRSWS